MQDEIATQVLAKSRVSNKYTLLKMLSGLLIVRFFSILLRPPHLSAKKVYVDAQECLRAKDFLCRGYSDSSGKRIAQKPYYLSEARIIFKTGVVVPPRSGTSY